MSESNGTAPQVNVPTEAVLQQVAAQRDKALTDLAVAQAACQQLAARVAELEAAPPGAERAPRQV
jgi:hypothetical protein